MVVHMSSERHRYYLYMMQGADLEMPFYIVDMMARKHSTFLPFNALFNKIDCCFYGEYVYVESDLICGFNSLISLPHILRDYPHLAI